MLGKDGSVSRGIAEGHFSFQSQKENICRKSKSSNSHWDMRHRSGCFSQNVSFTDISNRVPNSAEAMTSPKGKTALLCSPVHENSCTIQLNTYLSSLVAIVGAKRGIQEHNKNKVFRVFSRCPTFYELGNS